MSKKSGDYFVLLFLLFMILVAAAVGWYASKILAWLLVFP